MHAITSPVPQFFDLSGDPLDAGKIYIGTAGSNPITSPVTVYWDDAGTQPAAQPIRTVSGYPARNGKPARVYVETDDFSLSVMTRTDTLVQSELSVLSSATLRVELAEPEGAGLVGFDSSEVYPAGTVGEALALSSSRKVKVYNYLTAAQKLEAQSGLVTLDMSTQVQAALNAGVEIDWEDYTYLCTGLTAPTAVRAMYGTGTIKCATNSTTLIKWPADTSRTHVRWFGGGLKIDANSKTGCIGVAFGSVTNNPSAGDREAILYMGCRDLLVTGFETNIDSRVSMEHSWDNVVLKSGTVGLKLYSDEDNGGCNANTFRGLRLQSNQVGAIIKNNSVGYALPVHNNDFNGLLLQENTVCGMAFIGCVGQAINTVHIEGNGSGASSVTIDGYVIPKSDVHMDGSMVQVGGTDLASSLTPCFNLVNGSRLTTLGMTGYGSPSGTKVKCDATSTYHESGPMSGIGSSHNHASYGDLVAVTGLGFVSGAPLAQISRGLNLYASNPMYPSVSNVVGVTSTQNKRSEFGLTPEVTFAASVGNTGTNRLNMALMTCVANKYNISTFLVKTSADCQMTFGWRAGANQLNETIALSTTWTRVVFLSFNQTDHSVFIFPADTLGVSLQVQAVQSSSDDLDAVASIYASGTVNTSTELYNRFAAAPTTGTWSVGDVVWHINPAAGGNIGWVCTTAGTPGTWKTFGTIAA